MSPDDYKEAYEKCRRRYPTIDLSCEDFLARAKASGVDFARLCHEDLFLATACSRGDRIAWEYFADDYLPLVQRMAAQACRQFQESEDLAQEIVTGLIADKTKLSGYNGRGSLAGWLRVAIAHGAIDRFRRKRREVSLEETDGQEAEIPAEAKDAAWSGDPLDDAWGPILAGILHEQIRLLSARDRLILGLYYIHGTSLKIIGKRLGIHEATASRWLDSLRRAIRKQVERELRTRHSVRPGEIIGLWQWVAERGNLSLEQVLGSRRDVQESARTAPKNRSLEHKT